MAYHLNDTELYYFNEGISTAAYRSLGCHLVQDEAGVSQWRFAVWAPNARRISVVGDFNEWNPSADLMHPVGTTGIWEAHLGFAMPGHLYKYAIMAENGERFTKSDPFAVKNERDGSASMVAETPEFRWTDQAYERRERDIAHLPMSIYEVHPGSWKKGLSYRELAHELVDYVVEMGFTHIELMPVMAYPYDPSWGYQVTGYYCVTARYGEPEDLMYLVNRAHEKGIGVIMDWVPAHFTKDAYGLRQFDGSPLYEHPDPRRAEMPQWGTLLFDFERTQVQSFLLSSALFWLSEYHFDGLRVDAVSCMLYLDFGKKEGEWLPNRYGDNRNLAAVAFLKKLNEAVRDLPGNKLLFAEESSAYPCVTRPVQEGGLGFGCKWTMGWMNDILSYMEMDSLFRKWHHSKLTFTMCYAFSEQYVLPLSHDEVVHGKKSLLSKMPGDYWQKFAQLRLLYAYQYALPGKKLLFMGGEFGQFIEWDFNRSLDWLLLDYDMHQGMQRFVADLNRFYRDNPPFYEIDDGWDGFLWSSVDDNIHSVLCFFRRDKAGRSILCAFNFTPEPWNSYSLGVPERGTLTEVFSSDAPYYGGTGDFPNAPAAAKRTPFAEHDYTAAVRIPPYGAVFFSFAPAKEEAEE